MGGTHTPAKFDAHRHRVSGDTFSVCQVISQDYVTKGESNMDRSS